MSFLFQKSSLKLAAWLLCALPAAQANTLLAPVDCVINPFHIADISSPVPGVLEDIQVERSAWVERGQVLATMENSVEQATVALAKKRAEVDSEVQLADVNLQFDQKRQLRIGKLHERQAVSVEIRDEADREASLSRWEVQQARDLRDIRQLELRRARAQLEQKTIRSPLTGYVASIYRFPGEYVEDQPILRVVQLDPLLVEAVVPMEMFGQIHEGMEADVYPELQQNQSRVATVINVDPMGDAASRTFGVRLELDNPDNALPAGLKCEVKFRSVAENTVSP